MAQFGAPNFLAAIDAYESGSRQRERSRLADLAERGRMLTGQALQGDENAKRQLAGVDANAYMKVSSFTDQKKKAWVENFTREAYGATTPQTWKAMIDRHKAEGRVFSPGEDDFANRDALIARGLEVGDMMGLDLRREEAARTQGNADRSFGLQNRSFAADENYRAQQIALEKQKLATKDVPSGYELSPDGGLKPIAGGPADPLRPGGDATADFKDITSIRKEIQDLPSYKSYSAALPIYQTMVSAAGRDSKAADLNMVYGLAKIYDPTSVVREGETVMVRDTASLPDWLVGTINGLNGGARLQPETRKAMMQEAGSRIESYKSAFETNMQQFRGIAQRNRVNEQDIMPVMPPVAQMPQQGSTQGKTKSGIMFKVE